MNVLEAVRQNTEYLKKIDELEKKLKRAEEILNITMNVTNDSYIHETIVEYFK